jgi:two-component system, sensor histidine kinase
MKKRRNVRSILTHTFVVAAVVPFVLLLALGIHHARRDWHREGHRLAEVAAQAQRELDEYLEHHRASLLTLAEQLGREQVPVDAEVVEWLQAVHARHPGFTTMMAADASGAVLATVPRNVAGLDVSDRDYFQHVAAGRPWYVSGAFRGRGLGQAPIVALSARVQDGDGRLVGVVQGALGVDRFRHLERRFESVPDLRVLVLDHEYTVVYGGGDGRFQSLEPLGDAELLQTSRTGIVPVFHDRDGDGRRWITRSAVSQQWGWQIIVMQPVDLATRELLAYVAGLAAAVLWALLIMVVAVRRARRAVAPLEQLATAMREFSGAAPHRPLVLPDHAPEEIADLARSFDAMAERTHLVITGLVPICALCKRIRTDDEWEPVEAFVRARSEAEFTHGMCPDCTETLGFPALPEPAPERTP